MDMGRLHQKTNRLKYCCMTSTQRVKPIPSKVRSFFVSNAKKSSFLRDSLFPKKKREGDASSKKKPTTESMIERLPTPALAGGCAHSDLARTRQHHQR